MPISPFLPLSHATWPISLIIVRYNCWVLRGETEQIEGKINTHDPGWLTIITMSSRSGCVVRVIVYYFLSMATILLFRLICWDTHAKGFAGEVSDYNSGYEENSSRRLGRFDSMLAKHFKRHGAHTTWMRDHQNTNHSVKNEPENSDYKPLVTQKSTDVASTTYRHVQSRATGTGHLPRQHPMSHTASLRDSVLFYSFMTVSPDRKYRTQAFYDLPLRNKICYMQHKQYCWLIQTVGNSEIDSSPAKEHFIPTWYKPIGIWKILHRAAYLIYLDVDIIVKNPIIDFFDYVSDVDLTLTDHNAALNNGAFIIFVIHCGQESFWRAGTFWERAE